MADKKAYENTPALAVADITDQHIIRTSKLAGAGNNFILLQTIKEYASAATEITRAQAATIDTSNGGNGSWVDGALYRITNPLSPLVNVVMMATKDGTGFARLSMIGIATIATGSGYIHVECGYSPLTNVIHYIYEPKYNVRIEGSSSYGVIPLDDALYKNIRLTNVTTSITTPASCGMVNISSINSTISLSSSAISDMNIQNVTLIMTASASLTRCNLAGNGETITLPAGYTATGKTFISGVSSNFEYNIDLTDGAIYNATGGGSGGGLLTIPNNLAWVGKYIFYNAFADIEEIANLTHWTDDVVFTSDYSTAGGFVVHIVSVGSVSANKIIFDSFAQIVNGVSSITSPAFTDIPSDNTMGFAVIKRVGVNNIFIQGKSFVTTY